MAPFLRKVKTASGATAVQVVAKEGRRNRVLEHLGSAHSEVELAALMHLGRKRLHAGQEALDLDLTSDSAPAAGVLTMQARRSRYLLDTLEAAWHRLGFEVVDDEAFFQLVAARLIEPTSMSDSRRVLHEVGIVPVHRNTFHAALRRCGQREYRDKIARQCFEHVWTSGDVSLVLYDVATLYFEAPKEHELRKVGFSKERRVDPQIVVGLLVDRHGDAFTDGQPIDTITPRHGNTRTETKRRRREPVWAADEHPGHWRAIWAYSRKRDVHDQYTLTQQENRARAVIAGDANVKGTRFVKTTAAGRILDEASLKKARSLAGLKGYVTNIESAIRDCRTDR